MKPSTKNVKLIRKRLNMTQAELSELLGIDRTSLAHMENGRKVPRPVAMLLASLVNGTEGRAA